MSNAQPIDVRDMAIVHRTFRDAYNEAARLVRAAPAPSPERVTILIDRPWKKYATLRTGT